MASIEKNLTRNQRLVLDALVSAGEPLGAYAILDHLRNDGFRAPLQVYRALDKLLQNGRVHRLESLNAFVACSHEKGHKPGLVAFAICDDCGKVSEFSARTVRDWLQAWAKRQGFSPRSTVLEIRGTCDACAPDA